MGLPGSLLTLSVGGRICDLNILSLSNSYQALNSFPLLLYLLLLQLFTDYKGLAGLPLFCVLCLFRDMVCLVNSSYHLHLLAGYIFGQVFQGQQSFHKDLLTQNVRPTYWGGGRESHPSLDS